MRKNSERPEDDLSEQEQKTEEDWLFSLTTFCLTLDIIFIHLDSGWGKSVPAVIGAV